MWWWRFRLRGVEMIVIAALRLGDRHWAKLGKRARRAARRGRYGADIFVAVRARHSAPASLWDASPAVGKGGLLGAAPFLGPLCIPQEHPLRRPTTFINWRGHATRAAGASFPRFARSGDLPPRRVNARFRFRVGQNPLQPNTNSKLKA